MSYNDLPGFQTVGFKSEREGALKDLSKIHPLLSAVSSDHSTFIFKIFRVNGSRIFLESLEQSREVKSSEEIKFIFSLSTGQYAMVGPIEVVSGANSLELDFDKVELLRLQRRDSFRIMIPNHLSVLFYLNSKITAENAVKISDVSMGGMALKFPAALVASYWEDSSIKGSLVLSGREPLELEGIIRHHFSKEADGSQKMGVQFTNITPEQQRELLSLTLQLHRKINHKE